MRNTTKSISEKRQSANPSPFSMSSLTSKQPPRQQKNIVDIYSQVKQKIDQMEESLKEEHLMKQRQMLKTFVKVLDRIGEQVITAKQKYKNLDKQNLKTDKRLQIVTKLNEERFKCNQLAKNIKITREQIKKLQEENHFLQNEVQALLMIQKRKRSLSICQKTKYRQSRKYAKSLQKKWPEEFNQNDPLVAGTKPSIIVSRTFELRKPAKSHLLNSCDRSKQTQLAQYKTEQRPSTYKRQISNKRIRNKIIIIPFQQNSQVFS